MPNDTLVPLYSEGRRVANINVDYRPPRLSMFPMSYSERAWLRSLKRQALRQAEIDASRSKPEVTTRPTQTNVTYCNHQCPQHSEVPQANGGDGKKPKDGKGKDGSGEAHSKKDKGKGGKGKGKNRDSDDNDSIGSSDDEVEKKPKDKGKGGKVKEDKAKGDKGDKGDKGEKSKKGENQSPLNAFLPYPLNSPNFTKIAGSIRHPLERKEQQHPTLENAVESARRADEEYIMRWLADSDGSQVQSAVKWLEERDASRLARLLNLTTELSALNLNLQNPFTQSPWRPPGPATHPLSFNQGPPNVGLPAHHGPYGNAPGNDGFPANRDAGANRTVLASYDENTGLRLEDGTRIIIKGGGAPQGAHQGAPQGFATATPYLGSNRPPLQPVGDAGGRVHWRHPAQARPDTQNQAPFAGGPAYRQDHHPRSTDGNGYRQDQQSPAPIERPGFHQSQPGRPGRPRMNQQTPIQRNGGGRDNFNRPAPDENRKPNKWADAVEDDHGLGESNADEDPPWGGSNGNGGGGLRNSPAPGQNHGYSGNDRHDFNHDNSQNDGWKNTRNGGLAEWKTPAEDFDWENFNK